MQASCDEAGIPVRVLGEPPAFQPWFTDAEIFDHRDSLRADPARGFALAHALLERGVLKGHEKFFVSMAHDEDDIDRTIAAVEEAVAENFGLPQT